jgi:hypothetical protein
MPGSVSQIGVLVLSAEWTFVTTHQLMSDKLELECQLLVCLNSKSRKHQRRQRASKCVGELGAKMVNEAHNLFGEDFVPMTMADPNLMCGFGGFLP